MKKSAFLIIALVILINLGLWALLNRPAPPELPWRDPIRGVSFSPYWHHQDPRKNVHPARAEIEYDVRMLSDHVTSIRTYSSTDGMEFVPALARKYRLDVTAGAWLDKRLDRNEQEVKNLIVSAKRYRSVSRVIVGNETILRGDCTVGQLTAYLKRVRESVKRPVSTAEPWHVWLAHPELADHVDFIAIHVLPYWERVPAEKAVDWVMARYEQVRAAFPEKPILIAEVGWPSAGERRGRAKASAVNASTFLRRFLPAAAEKNLDYFVMEAFDQPWKRPMEGVVGGHWGLFDVTRQPKFDLKNEAVRASHWPREWAAATLLALLPVALYVLRRKNQPLRGRFLFALLIQLCGSLLVWYCLAPVHQDFGLFESVTWLFLLPLELALLAVVLVDGFEMSEMLWPDGLRRRFAPVSIDTPRPLPLVSIHVAAYNEPPDMVIKTLDSLRDLEYPHYEVLVIDNNTVDPAVWQPVRDHCMKLGPRFRFFHLDKWPGFKAGALNFGLNRTDPRAEIIGVVDSDYMVRQDWLKVLVPYFENPKVAIVQAPQDHREWKGDAFKTMCNWEYHGFFQIGMIHRNERNAIIQHGTMTLVRKSSLQEAGRWGEWCICEDAELGLRILSLGYESVYVNESFGQGLTPDSFAGYKRQRFRWAYGAVQILKRHWRSLLPGRQGGQLTLGQRYHFAAGWFPWFADSVNLCCTCIALSWAVGMFTVPKYFGTPIPMLLYPTIGVFAFKLMRFYWLYKARVRCGFFPRLGAAIAGMSLIHTIARAMISGLFTSNQPFLRTPKCEDKRAVLRAFLMAWEEIMICLLLWLAAVNLVVAYGSDDVDILLWACFIMVQSLPYAAAVFTSMVNVMPAVVPGRVPAPALTGLPDLRLPAAAMERSTADQELKR